MNCFLSATSREFMPHSVNLSSRDNENAVSIRESLDPSSECDNALDSSKGIEPEDIDIDHQGTGEGISQELELASMGAQFQSQYEGAFPDDLENDMDAPF